MSLPPQLFELKSQPTRLNVLSLLYFKIKFFLWLISGYIHSMVILIYSNKLIYYIKPILKFTVIKSRVINTLGLFYPTSVALTNGIMVILYYSALTNMFKFSALYLLR